MKDMPTARAGYFQGDRMELGLRYAYRSEFVPLLMGYLGAMPGTSILEVGCGTGFLARLLARTLSDVHVLGLDSDPGLLNIARKMQAREELKDISWAQGNAFRLPFPDNCFDLVVSHRLLWIVDDVAQGLREQIRVTRPGGTVSAVACFCHSDGLPHYHGRYPLPGDRRLHDLAHKLWQVYRRTVRPRLLAADLSAPNQELLWVFRSAGLEDAQINGHLILVSPGDARIPLEDALPYALARHEIERERLEKMREAHGEELAEAGFSQAEFRGLLELRRARYDYLKANAERVRQVMEVYTDPLLIVKGTKPEPVSPTSGPGTDP